jgi:putative ABC transport system permease protein
MLALKNLRRHRLRTFLTLMGVAIGIATLVAISGYSHSLKDQIQQTVIKRFDLVVLSKGASSPLASRLVLADYKKLLQVEGVSETAGIVIGAVKTKANPYFLIAGTTSYEPLAGNLRLVAGRLPGENDGEILLGRKAFKRLNATINEKVTLTEGYDYTVVGCFDAGSRFFDQGAIMGLSEAQTLLNRQGDLNLALVRFHRGQRPKTIITRIQSILPHLDVLKSKNLLGEIRLFIVVDKVTWGLSAIALIVSTIFVINTLIMAVTERTKEIGILMAIGWSRRMIVGSLIAESIIVCILGGMVGLFGGWALLWGFGQSHITGLDWSAGTLSPGIIAWAMALSFGLGLISSVYPAWVASRLTPAQALRTK